MAKLDDYGGGFLPDLEMSDFSPDTLVQLLKLYSKLYMAMDGFWYFTVKGGAGDKEALACDIKVWEDMVKYEALMIKRQLKIRGNDVAALMKITQLCPWFQLTESNIEIEGSSRAVLTIVYCPTLDSLEKKSEGAEYETCNVVCRRINEGIAAFCNPDIKVNCLKLPPRESRDDICCQWEFILGG